MAGVFPDAVLPGPAPPQAENARAPRNYLSAKEYRRLFWAVMPPAIVIVVALELFTRPLFDPPPGPPAEPQVDTRIVAVVGPPPGDDAVVILPADMPPETVDEALLGASLAALTRVRDATFLGTADRDAWLETCLTLQGFDGRVMPTPADVGFTELFSQPRSFRGRAVRIRGLLHRLERLESVANDYGIDHFWQGWLEPAGGPATPVAVHFLQVPEGMASGLDIREPVEVSGFFLKNMAYRAGDGVRVAPLILAREPVRPGAGSADRGLGFWDRSISAVGVATMLAVVTAIGIAFLIVGRGRRRRLESTDLDLALSGVEPFSVADSLRRVAADEVAGNDDPRGEANT